MTDFDLQMSVAKLAEALLPDNELRQQRANAAVISPDGGVHSRALMQSLPWYRADVSIPGTVAAGSDVKRVPFPQGATIRHLSAHAHTAPTGTFGLRLSAGTESQNFGLQAGQRTSMHGANLHVDAGAWLVIDVTSAGGAADIDLTVHYTPGGA